MGEMMFQKKPMRRQERQLGAADTAGILEKGLYGILSTVSSDGSPYGVPLSYVYDNDAIYFHCALCGHKLDNIIHDQRVSFCVVGEANTMPREFSTEYESVIVFGKTSEVTGVEKTEVLRALIRKYAEDYIEKGEGHITKHEHNTKVIKISIDYYTGKANRCGINAV